MCPPSRLPPSAEINFYWSDEQIISFLDQYRPGSRLPDNVLADSSPYQCQPSNLPEGIWYLVHLNEKKESVYGFWKAKGEPCKIYSNTMIIGWRTTLEYFEGLVPHGQRTDWLMQEYRVTPTELYDKDKPKESSRLLCRVFFCDGYSSKSEMNALKLKIGSEAKKINPVVLITPGQEPRNEAKANREGEVGAPLLLEDDKPNSSLELSSERECFLEGDFLELNDLIPESHSSSSQNSSCPSELSDEYFDSAAFLRDLEEEENKNIQEQQSSSGHNFIASVRPNDIVLQPPTSGSLSNVIEGRGTDSTIHESSGPSTSHGNATSRGKKRGEKKARSGRMKKLKMYFCFALF